MYFANDGLGVRLHVVEGLEGSWKLWRSWVIAGGEVAPADLISVADFHHWIDARFLSLSHGRLMNALRMSELSRFGRDHRVGLMISSMRMVMVDISLGEKSSLSEQ